MTNEKPSLERKVDRLLEPFPTFFEAAGERAWLRAQACLRGGAFPLDNNTLNKDWRQLMSLQEAYRKKLLAQLDEWSAEIDKIEAKAMKMKADVQIESMKEIDDLRAKRAAAADKLAALENAGNDAWEDLKTGIESAWESLASAVKSASARFK